MQLRRVMRLWYTLALFLLMIWAGQAQDDALEIRDIDDSNFPQLVLYVNVSEDIGVDAVSPADFEVQVAGAPATIQSLEVLRSDDAPISILLAIDTSESMDGTPLQDVRAAVTQLLDRLSEGDEVALLVFDETLQVIVAYTPDLQQVRDALDNLVTDGRTALYDAAGEATSVLAPPQTDRQFVIFLTDGNEYGGISQLSKQDSLVAVAEAGVPFFAIGLGYSVDENYLMALATRSNGASYILPSSDALSEMFDNLSNYLRTDYLLTIETDLMMDGTEVPVTVSLADHAATINYTTAVADVVAATEEPMGEPILEVLGFETEALIVGTQLHLETRLAPASASLDEVIYRIDGEIAQQAQDATFVLDTLAYMLGEHILEIEAVSAAGTFTQTEEFVILPVTGNTSWQPVTELRDGVEMALVPAGCFDMGGGSQPDQQPAHQICFSQSFWIDRYPVTNAQYGSSGLFTGADNPRDRLTWQQADAYCRNSRAGRLPTEAEWEYAARGPDNLIYPWGNLYQDNLAVMIYNADGTTHPVGSNPGNRSWVEAQDMSGNIWEWTSSVYLPYPYVAEDGREAEAEADSALTLRVLRGGSANNNESDLTALNRYPRLATTGAGLVGMRCVQDYNTGANTDE